MKSKATIDLNGVRYDAKTGAKLGTSRAKPTAQTVNNMDGFFRGRATTAAHSSTIHAPAPAPNHGKQPRRTVNHVQAHTPQPAKSAATRVSASYKVADAVTLPHHSSSVNHRPRRTLQSSTTLMRKAVKRPDPSFHKQAKTKASLQHAVPSLIAVKSSVSNLDVSRLIRAKEVSRSPHISHLSNAAGKSLLPKVAPLAVQPTPDQPQAHVPHGTVAPAPNKPVDIFEHALANASHYIDVKSHSRAFKKKTRNHALSMAAGTLGLLVIAGFAAYQNTPGLQFKVASIQAGVSTHMPNFKAAGFAYNGAHSSDGKLMVGFSGNNGKYQVTQQPTNWSSDDMINNIGATDATGRPIYTTVKAGNVTVYRFSNTDATWVDNGTWYSVNGTGSLSNQQVTKLVQNI